MEKARHGGKHSGKDSRRRKHSTKSKKRKSHEENGTSSPENDGTVVTGDKPLVEYSDVSSEDLSGPEAGEIQSGEDSVFGFSDDEDELAAMNRGHRHRYRNLLEEEYYLAARMMRSPPPPRRVHPELLAAPRSPSLPRERKTSASSRSSPSSEVRARRKIDSSPIGDYRQIEESPYDDTEMERRKRKRKEKKHKRDKKTKKKKKKSKHHSRSTSVDDSSDSVPIVAAGQSTKGIGEHQEQEPLSDWEAPATVEVLKHTVDKIDTSACSPVSNDSHIASPEPEEFHERHRTPPISPVRLLRDVPPRESPHTPPLLPSRSYSSSHTVIVRERSISPVIIAHERERTTRIGYVCKFNYYCKLVEKPKVY